MGTETYLPSRFFNISIVLRVKLNNLHKGTEAYTSIHLSYFPISSTVKINDPQMGTEIVYLLMLLLTVLYNPVE